MQDLCIATIPSNPSCQICMSPYNIDVQALVDMYQTITGQNIEIS